MPDFSGGYGDTSAEEKVFTVSEISRLIKGTLESSFPSIWVEGELTKALIHTSGHLYATIKEGKDVLDITMWKASVSRLVFEPETGMQVLVHGRISTYGPYGKYQITADRMEPAGLGALQIRFEQLKKKLEEKGYFSPERKKPLPPYPKVIGVVTSQTGAAIRDIIRVLKTRDRGIKIILAPVLVEGEQAKEQIARAIDDFNEYGKIDLMIVGRGGGSPESLWAFNEEVVADAIFRSRIPIISAVGHEIDVTISDFVADARASTPSNAAEMAVKVRADVVHAVNVYRRRIHQAARNIIREKSQSLKDLTGRTVFTDPTRFLENSKRRVDENLTRVTNAVKRNRSQLLNHVVAQYKHLQLLKPSNLIRRKKEHLANLKRHIYRGMKGILAAKREKMAAAHGAFLAYNPREIARRRREKLEAMLKGLEHAVKTPVNSKREKFGIVSGRLNALSPLRVLERGYSITRKADGSIVRDASQVDAGETLDIRLHRGEIAARVESKKT